MRGFLLLSKDDLEVPSMVDIINAVDVLKHDIPIDGEYERFTS